MRYQYSFRQQSAPSKCILFKVLRIHCCEKGIFFIIISIFTKSYCTNKYIIGIVHILSGTLAYESRCFLYGLLPVIAILRLLLQVYYIAFFQICLDIIPPVIPGSASCGWLLNIFCWSILLTWPIHFSLFIFINDMSKFPKSCSSSLLYFFSSSYIFWVLQISFWGLNLSNLWESIFQIHV